MYYGYIRVSTSHQNLERQLENITRYFVDHGIKDFRNYEEKGVSGTTHNRPCFQKLLKKVESGDTIVFDEVSRMSRNAEEGFQLYQELFEKGINLVFLKEPHINTDVYEEARNKSLKLSGDEIADCYIEATNKVFMILARKQIQIAFDQAQAENDLRNQRISEGMQAKKKTGAVYGRSKGSKVETKKAVSSKIAMIKAAMTFNGTMKDKEVIELLGIRPNTYYKYKKELLEELEERDLKEILKELESK